MNYRFESPWLLALLIIPIILALLPFLNRLRRKPASLRYADIRLVNHASYSWRIYAQPILPILRLLALALVIIAVARPQLNQSREVIHGEGVDIALALDISGSMASLDFEPQNRLAAAKMVIADFVEARPYDRIGLVVFAQSAFNQSPPTIDHNVLLRLLEQVKLAPELNIQDGTAIGLGVANAANMLKDSKVNSRVLILLTDGVNNAGQIDPLTAAEAAKSLGIKVYTIGMGKTGQVPVPSFDFFGREIITYQESVIDEETLQKIAETTGGLYFRAEDITGLEQVYEEINQLEKSEIEVQVYTSYRELFPLVLGPAVFLFLLELLLRQTILRRIP
jgi:Ca-activated chloride channel family protein